MANKKQWRHCAWLLLILVMLSSFQLFKLKTQDPIYSFQDLSRIALSKQRDSIKKNWNCPKIFDKKETQKKYEEMWDSRKDFIVSSINDNDYVYEKEVYDYISGILTELVKANKAKATQQFDLLLDRSSVVNAYAIGGNIIAVNLGLIEFAESKEELALILAHELSHNILEHSETALRERAELLTSDAYKNTLNSVLDSKYERLTRLKKILEGYTFSRSRHNRYKESEADSMAVQLLKKANISFNARYFLKLDSSDLEYQTPLKHPVGDYFRSYGLKFEDWWTTKKTKGLSSRNYNFKDTTKLQDSLKTHPDCIQRYEKTKALSSATMTVTPIPKTIKTKVNKMILWNLFNNQNLTACLYRIMLVKDNNNSDAWYDFMFHNSVIGLYYSDKNLMRFNSINVVQKELVSKNYFELQTALEQMPTDDIKLLYEGLQKLDFWKSLNSDEKGLRDLFNSLANADYTDKSVRPKASKNYVQQYPNSMYAEFAVQFSN
ncbi:MULTISPECIES: M48 family metalloprotease [unclassified Paraflavitalea]|uniref:M48 family metalloprotease n=1 Tax=unclassified Paraflavitalea TaxID=2798305 RepID=UPI003D353FE7